MSMSSSNPLPNPDAFSAEDSLFPPPEPAAKPSETPPSDLGPDTLAREVRVLRRQLLVVMMVLAIFCGSANLFFLRQVSLIRKQSAEIQQLVAEYKNSQVPMMNEVLAKLRGYAQTQPDFRPILERYFPTAPAPASAPAPRPVPPPPAKRSP